LDVGTDRYLSQHSTPSSKAKITKNASSAAPRGNSEMSFYLSVSLAVFALVAYDLITGKTTFGARGLMGMRPGATRRDDPKHFWIGVAWRIAIALGLAALAFFHVPDPK
jgi:hypothetical protein